MAVIRMGRTRVLAPLTERRTWVAPPLALQLLHEVEQHDGVGDHDADQHQEADHGADAQWVAGDEQRRDGADERQRQAEQDDERRDERAQGQHHHDVDHQDGDAHREEQRAEGLVSARRGSQRT